MAGLTKKNSKYSVHGSQNENVLRTARLQKGYNMEDINEESSDSEENEYYYN